jgi:geranylgeranyl diphosphate synthase type I
MNLQQYFDQTRSTIAKYLTKVIQEEVKVSANFGGESSILFSTIKDYAISGKMLRGSLARLGSDLFDQEPKPASGKMKSSIVKVATALELFQAGLLAHDDIMDEDAIRRGLPTLHKSFEFKEAPRCPDAHISQKLGISMGICAGDIFFFLAWRLLSESGIKNYKHLGKIFSRELVDVCLAQTTDVRYGSYRTFPTLQEVIEVYTYKTANYTITLPLCSGAIIAGRIEAIPYLEEIGNNLGILFQLQDDYLGLFGNEKDLGKPIGSDIKEGKKTPFIVLLLEHLTPKELDTFNNIFSAENVSSSEIDYIRALVIHYNVHLQIRSLAEEYALQAKLSLEKLNSNISKINPMAFSLLEDFIEYSLSRGR